MIELDTFVIILYIMVDDYCQSQGLASPPHPGPQVVLSCGEVVTLAILEQWAQFESERALHRHTEHHFR